MFFVLSTWLNHTYKRIDTWTYKCDDNNSFPMYRIHTPIVEEIRITLRAIIDVFLPDKPLCSVKILVDESKKWSYLYSLNITGHQRKEWLIYLGGENIVYQVTMFNEDDEQKPIANINKHRSSMVLSITFLYMVFTFFISC